MTIPNTLVTAAAKALCRRIHGGIRDMTYPCLDCQGDARAALAAAFRALPKCAEARAVMDDTTVDLKRQREYRLYETANAYLAALAGMVES